MKDAIRRRGENISSFDIEIEADAHPAVAESAAVAVPSEWGEDEVKLVVTLSESASVEPEELHEFLASRLPKFMIPRYIEVVDILPRTPTLKVRKVILRNSGISSVTWDSQAAVSR